MRVDVFIEVFPWHLLGNLIVSQFFTIGFSFHFCATFPDIWLSIMTYISLIIAHFYHLLATSSMWQSQVKQYYAQGCSVFPKNDDRATFCRGAPACAPVIKRLWCSGGHAGPPLHWKTEWPCPDPELAWLVREISVSLASFDCWDRFSRIHLYYKE